MPLYYVNYIFRRTSEKDWEESTRHGRKRHNRVRKIIILIIIIIIIIIIILFMHVITIVIVSRLIWKVSLV